MPNEDYFDDVPELKQAQFGALGGEGASALERTSTTVTRDGIVTHCMCGQCGAPNVVTVFWPEAVVGSLALVPEGWKANPEQHALSPYSNAACRCGYWVELLFTPAELDRYLNTAANQGLISAQGVANEKAKIRAMAGQGRGAPPPQYRR